MKVIFTTLFIMLLVTSCYKFKDFFDKDTPNPLTEKEVTSFKVVNGADTVNFTITDSTIEGVKPDTGSRSALPFLVEYKGESISLTGATLDFTNPVSLTVTAEDGSKKTYSVKLRSFTGLPIVYITSPPIQSKDDYVTGVMKIDGNLSFPGGEYPMEIKLRGNSTAWQVKSPWKVKLNTKASVLGMPADKEWGLLANFFDKSLMRNDAYFELSERLAAAWTPKRRHVDVFVNGSYNGTYLLCELVKIAKDRVNITAMKKDPTDVSGGYLVEANRAMDEKQNWWAPTEIPMSLKEPEEVSAQQFQYIQDHFNGVVNSIYSWDKDLSGKIDIDSWIKWSIVNEVFRNRDAILFGSCYFYKGEGGKIYAGPVWDADLSAGGYVQSFPEGWYVNTANMFNGIWGHNAAYTARYKQIWKEYKPKIASMPEYISTQEKYLDASQKKNWQKWNFSESAYADQIVHPNYVSEVSALRTFLGKRIAWMDSQLN